MNKIITEDKINNLEYFSIEHWDDTLDISDHSHYAYIWENVTNGKRYVGITHHIKKRIRRHISNGEKSSLGHAIQKHGQENFVIALIPVENREQACEMEQILIEKLDTVSPNGYNLTHGGEHNFSFSEETIQKMSEAKLGEKCVWYGRKHTEETKKKMSDFNKGKTMSEESKVKMREAKEGMYFGEDNPMYGRKHTEESKRKMSKNRSGIPVSEETRQKLSIAGKGKKRSEETKRRMSEARSGENHHFYGKKLSEETKRKMSEVKMGKKQSEETKRKISETKKAKKFKHSEETKRKMSEARKKYYENKKNDKYNA